MFAFSRVHLHQFLRVPVCPYILKFAFSCVFSSNLLFCMCAYIRLMFLFARVCLHQNGCLFSFASKFKCLLFLLCVFIKRVAFNLVRLYFHVCLFSCVPISKGLLFLLCVNIMFSFTHVCQHQNSRFFSPLCLHQNVSQFSFASTRCTYIKMFPFTRVNLHQNLYQF